MMPQDKLIRLLAGITIAAAAYPFWVAASMLAVFGLAIGNELWDSWGGKGTPDAMDAAATIGGGFALLFWFELAERYL